MRTLKSPHAETRRFVTLAVAIVCMCTVWSSFSCSHDIRQSDDRSASVPPPDPLTSNNPRPVAPMQCRIRATVVNITAVDTLGTAPGIWCRVRVDSILGYGSSFGLPLHEGSVITVRCATYGSQSVSNPAEALWRHIAAGSVIMGNTERNSVDDDGADVNFTLYDIVIIQ